MLFGQPRHCIGEKKRLRFFVRQNFFVHVYDTSAIPTGRRNRGPERFAMPLPVEAARSAEMNNRRQWIVLLLCARVRGFFAIAVNE